MLVCIAPCISLLHVISTLIDFLDIPLVSLSYQITEVIIGSDTILNCSYESYPEPTMVYWKKDEKIIKLSDSSRTKYNGSSEEIPVLIIYDTTLSDSGKYICYVKNDIGTGHSKTLQLIVKGIDYF